MPQDGVPCSRHLFSRQWPIDGELLTIGFS
jgi:hypothetical protein